MDLSEENQDLLWRYWSEETNEQENRLVEKKLAEDPGFAAEYKHLVRVWQYSRYAGKWDRIDPGKAWRKIRMKQGVRKRSFLKYCAVAASVVFIIGTGFICFYHFRPATHTVVEWAEVIPGSPKAQLILASGQKIDLNKDWQQKIAEEGVLIDRDTACLRYEVMNETHGKAIACNELIVPRGGEYRLQLSDGTKISLNADSRLKYPVAFTGECRKVWLEGEAYFEVTADSLHPFMVETASVGVKVLGTGFNVMAYRQDQRTEVTLVHGHVKIRTVCGNTVLCPDQQLVFQDTDKTQEVRGVNAEDYVSWKEGILNFNGMLLCELADKLERWYDVDFFFSSEQLKQLKFSGAFKKYNDIRYVLDLIEETTDVVFMLSERTVTVSSK